MVLVDEPLIELYFDLQVFRVHKTVSLDYGIWNLFFLFLNLEKNCSESFWMFWNHSEWFRMLPSWFSKLRKCLELNLSHNRWSTRIYKGLKTKPIVKNDSHETKWYYCDTDFRDFWHSKVSRRVTHLLQNVCYVFHCHTLLEKQFSTLFFWF